MALVGHLVMPSSNSVPYFLYFNNYLRSILHFLRVHYDMVVANLMLYCVIIQLPRSETILLIFIADDKLQSAFVAYLKTISNIDVKNIYNLT